MRAGRFCFALLVAGVFAAACSASSATPAGYNQDYSQQGGPTNVPYNAGQAGPAASFGGGPQFGGAGATPGVATSGSTNNPSVPESQIVKIGTIKIQVGAIDDAIARATDQIHALGGWLAGSDRQLVEAGDAGSVTYRVPVGQFENALAAMRKFGSKVLSEHTDTTPVGGAIVDLQARIANLQTSEKAIQGIMAKAANINDVLTVQQRLTDVQGQIEQLSGELNGLTDQAAYSTLTVQFVVPYAAASPTPVATMSPSPTPIPWSAGDQAGQAAGALGQVGEAATTLLIWIAILIVPVTLAIILLLALLTLAGRLLDKYRRQLLPFTVAQPAQVAARPYGSQQYGSQPYGSQPFGGSQPAAPATPAQPVQPAPSAQASQPAPSAQPGPISEDKPKY